MRKRIILLIALLTVVLAFASCKNKTKYTVSVKWFFIKLYGF